MPSSRRIRSTIAYIICVSVLVVLALAVKAGAVIIANQLLYSIPILGGILRSLELIEVLNILVFAMLGMGLGVAAQLLGQNLRWQISKLILIVLIPAIFMSGSLFHYQVWLDQVGRTTGMERADVLILTNGWLNKTVQGKGFWGFYQFTARYTTLPKRAAEVEQALAGAERVNDAFAKILSQESAQVQGWLHLMAWGLRLFYFVVASVSAIVHFREGMLQVQRRAQRPIAQKVRQDPDKTTEATV